MTILWYVVGIIGCTAVWDGVVSITLYLNAPDYQGSRQTWRKDHWVRLVRIVCGTALIVIAGYAIATA